MELVVEPPAEPLVEPLVHLLTTDLEPASLWLARARRPCADLQLSLSLGLEGLQNGLEGLLTAGIQGPGEAEGTRLLQSSVVGFRPCPCLVSACPSERTSVDHIAGGCTGQAQVMASTPSGVTTPSLAREARQGRRS